MKIDRRHNLISKLTRMCVFVSVTEARRYAEHIKHLTLTFALIIVPNRRSLKRVRDVTRFRPVSKDDSFIAKRATSKTVQNRLNSRTTSVLKRKIVRKFLLCFTYFNG